MTSAVEGRMVFVGGLHRSGTTPLARWLAEHPSISGFSGTGVPEDEGQHLQSVYAPVRAHGGPGRFARSPGARLTEEDLPSMPAARERLMREWGAHWDLSCPLLLEKSPPNLVRTRFLQAVFPRASFIVVIRHPAAVALATRKWRRRPGRWWALDGLLRHWLTAHELLLADAPQLANVLVVRYEDLVGERETTLERIWTFLGVGPWPVQLPVRTAAARAYLREWNRPRVSVAFAEQRLAVARHDAQVRRFGYSLRDPAERVAPCAELTELLRGRRRFPTAAQELTR